MAQRIGDVLDERFGQVEQAGPFEIRGPLDTLRRCRFQGFESFAAKVSQTPTFNCEDQHMKQMSSISQSSTLQIHEWIDFALDRNEVNYLSNMIRVRWNKRFVRRFADAGYILNPTRGIIRISPLIWERASETERRETIIHEACHIVAFHLHGTAIKPHGVEWRQAMANCEVEPVRCHNIPLIGINQFYVRECPKANEDRCYVSRRKLGDMRRNGTLLHCLTCGLQVDQESLES